MLFKKRLLIIDTSDSARTILFKELLSSLPEIDIIACGSAREALTATKRFEFEIITTGLSLPDMDGYDMISEIRKQHKNKDTPIFVVSGDTRTQVVDAENDDANAITAYFDKAEGHKSLVNFISDFLSKESTLNARILYVDQSATSTAITTSILDKNHFSYVHVKDGEAALNELRMDYNNNNQKCSFDILISGLTLNRQMSGFELIQAIRNELNYNYLTLPVLLMTVEPSEDEKTDFTGIFGAGANDFITKPITEDNLIDRVVNLINIKRQNEALTSFN